MNQRAEKSSTEHGAKQHQEPSKPLISASIQALILKSCITSFHTARIEEPKHPILQIDETNFQQFPQTLKNPILKPKLANW